VTRFIEIELGRLGIILEDDGERAKFLLKPLEDDVDALFMRLRHDQLGAIPTVWDQRLSHCFRELGLLIEVPDGDVVVHFDHGVVKRIEVDRVADTRSLVLLLSAAAFAYECHAGKLSPRNAAVRLSSSCVLAESRNPCPSPS